VKTVLLKGINKIITSSTKKSFPNTNVLYKFAFFITMDLNQSDQVLPGKNFVEIRNHRNKINYLFLIYLLALISDLLSYEEEKYNYVLKTYFTEDAILTHPILNVQGRENIRKVFRVWTSLNKQPPEMINKDHLVFK
jgi:hypothetical protein